MKAETRDRIQAFLMEFVGQLITVSYSLEELEQAYPFHSLFFRGEALKAFKQQRSIVTRMGMKLYPTLAEMIALDQYTCVSQLSHPGHLGCSKGGNYRGNR